MPRLLIASGIFHPESGGPATYLHHLLPRLQAHGWEVRAISYGDSEASDYPYPLIRIPRRVLPRRLGQYGRAAWPLLRWADLVYSHTLGLPLIGGAAPRVLKVVGDQAWERAIRRGWIAPTEDIDDFQNEAYGPAVHLQKALRSREVRGMDRIIVPSNYLKRIVVGWGVNPARVQVIYNALPPDTVTSDLSQAEARTRLNLPEVPLLLTAARLHPWKGVDHLIAALAQVPHIQLLVAGDGPMRGALEKQAATLGVQDRVRFLEQVPHEQMPLYMKAADYLALYSGYEGLSHTLLEGLRAGTPVIASDKGGNPEVVSHNVNGLLVPHVDVDALAEALHKAFQPGKHAELAANSALGMDRFAFAHMVEATDAVLRHCLPSSST